MQCPRCNAPLEAGTTFCGNCGAQIAPVNAPGATISARSNDSYGGVGAYNDTNAETRLSSTSGYNPPSNPPAAGQLTAPPIRTRSAGPNLRFVLIGLVLLVVVAAGTLAALTFLRGGTRTSGNSALTPTVGTNAGQTFGRIFFGDGPNGAGHTDSAKISLNGLQAPPAGAHYYAWLVNTENEQIVPLGQLNANNGVFEVNFAGTGHGGNHGVNLIGSGNEVQITQESGTPNLPTGKVILANTFPPLAFVHIRHLLFAFATTPHNVGLLVGLHDQAQLLNSQSPLLKNDVAGGNTVATRCQAQNMLNIIEGNHGHNFQPLNALCSAFSINASGDGFGILGNNGYTHTASLHASLAATQADSTADIKTHARHLQICTDNITGWLTKVDQDLVGLIQNPQNGGKVAEIVQLTDHAYNGVDINGDETIDPIPGEGGAVTAYDHGQLMASLTLEPK